MRTGSIALGAAIAVLAPAATAKPPSDRQALLAVERAWDHAIVARDFKALDHILADDFVLIWIDGSVSHKSDLIASVRERKVTIDPFSTEDVLVRLYGDSAVVTGRFTQTVRLGARSETNSFRYTDVYHRTRRGWQAVSAHASLLNSRS